MKQPTLSPRKLHRYSVISSFVSSMLGLLLLATCWRTPLHILFAVLLAAAMLCMHTAASNRTGRIILRIIAGSAWIWLALILVETADAIYGGMTASHITRLQDGIVWFGGPLLSYIAPVAAATALFCGEHTTLYDRLTGRVFTIAPVGIAAVALFTDAGVPWPLDGSAMLPSVWLALTLVAAVLLFISLATPTDAQQAAVDARRARIAQKRAAKQAKP